MEEKIARMICEDRGYDPNRLVPDRLIPGNLPKTKKDGVCPNGDPGHFVWRQFVPLAKKIITAITNHHGNEFDM